MNFAIPCGQLSGELPGAYTSSRSLVVECASCIRCGSCRDDAVKGTPSGAPRSQFDSGGRIYTNAWCTRFLAEGRSSDIWIHFPSEKFIGTISYVDSTSPR